MNGPSLALGNILEAEVMAKNATVIQGRQGDESGRLGH